jgi:hypothetical protein
MSAATLHPAVLRLSLALPIGLSAIGLGCRGSAADDSGLAGMPASEVKQVIDSKVLAGTSVEELPAVLDSLGIDYIRHPVKAGDVSFSTALGVPAGAIVFSASVSGDSEPDVHVLFVLDDQMRVERVVVGESEQR